MIFGRSFPEAQHLLLAFGIKAQRHHEGLAAPMHGIQEQSQGNKVGQRPFPEFFELARGRFHQTFGDRTGGNPKSRRSAHQCFPIPPR